ncbi:MAG: SAM-dependent methyltransferase [Streptosporangiaceae bacterium]
MAIVLMAVLQFVVEEEPPGEFFDGQSLIEPGVVRIPEWRPDAPADRGIPSTMWGGAGRKP